MATSRQRRLTEEEMGETMSDSESNLLSEDEILTAFDYANIDCNDEDVPEERQWHYGTFTPTITQFLEKSGLQNTTSLVGRTSLDCFQLFFDETTIRRIANETNRYYLQNPMSERQHMSNRQNVDSGEVYPFLAITMLTGLIDKNRIRDSWSTEPLLATPIFSQYFTRNRYQDILRYIHVGNNEGISNTNRLGKTKPIVDHFKRKFANGMNPTQNLCVDESLVLWKVRHGFKQYIPTKRHRF